MTVYYVGPSGSNTAPYDTWAKAANALSTIAAIDVAGDTVYVDKSSNELISASTTLSWAGTLAAPTKIISADPSTGAPPSPALAGATLATGAGAYPIAINGMGVYHYGYSFTSGISSSSASATLAIGTTAGGVQIFDTCVLKVATTSGTALFLIGSSNAPPPLIILRNTIIQLSGNTAQAINIGDFSADLVWEGGSLLASAAITSLIKGGGNRAPTARISGVDLSAAATAMNVLNVASSSFPAIIILRDCKMPSGWSGSPITGTIAAYPCRVELHNCNAGNVNYAIWVKDYAGEIVQETTIVRTGGASDGTTPLSWKMSSTANASFPAIVLNSPEIHQWNDTSGSSKTATVEFIHDTNVSSGQGSGTAFAFQNNEVWLEVMYLSDSNSPLGSWISSGPATPLTTPTDDPSSSVAWTTTGLTTPLKQKLSVTFTPQQKGVVVARVVVAKASKIIYVDPLITIS